MDESSKPLALRRAADGGWLQARLKERIRRSQLEWNPVVGGRLLLLAIGFVTTATTPLLRPDAHSWRVLFQVGVVMTGVFFVSFVLPWARLPRSATLAFPIAVWSALAVLGLAARGLGANFAGTFTLCFAYVGLTQTSKTCLLVLVPGSLAYVASWDGWSSALTARLPIASTAWIILSLVLAALMRRQEALTEQLSIAAHTDALTGVANRRDLDRRLVLAQPGDMLVMCDLDNFKALNDAQGHAAGDRVLADFGLILRAALREKDYAARYGGEEFAILLQAADVDQAHATMQRLRTRWQVLQPDVTFSAGIARCRAGRDANATLQAADEALYRAKAAGRNCDADEASSDATFQAA